MFKNRKSTVLLLMLFSLSLIITGCGGGGEESSSSGSNDGRNNTFIIVKSNDAKLIDPGYAWIEASIGAVYPVFEGLVQFKNDKLDVESALATDWKKSEDGKTWTFNLRKGVKFHDGTDFNADAVVFSFNRVLDENHPMNGVVKGGWSYLKYLMGDMIEEVKALDEYTVQFKLKQKFSPFLTYMGYYSQFIVSPAAAKEYNEKFPENPVGTGPFKFNKWKKGEYIQYVANEDYWGEKPKVNKLIIKVVPESSTRLMELQTGQVNAIKTIDAGQIEKIKENDDLKLISKPGANIFFAAMNTKKEPLNNVKVRQAINYAVDVEKLVQGVYEGSGTPAVNVLPPTVAYFDDQAKPYEQNIEKAKQLLAEAGYPDGFDLELHTFTNARVYVSKPIQVAEIMKSDLKKVGINVKITTTQYSTLSDIMENYEHDIALTGWYDIPYPSNFLKTCALGGNHTGYKPQELVDIANKALATYDSSQQKEYYQELQQKLHEAAPVIPIAHRNYTAAVSSNVKGFQLTPVGVVRAHKAYIE